MRLDPFILNTPLTLGREQKTASPISSSSNGRESSDSWKGEGRSWNVVCFLRTKAEVRCDSDYMRKRLRSFPAEGQLLTELISNQTLVRQCAELTIGPRPRAARGSTSIIARAAEPSCGNVWPTGGNHRLLNNQSRPRPGSDVTPTCPANARGRSGAGIGGAGRKGRERLAVWLNRDRLATALTSPDLTSRLLFPPSRSNEHE